MIFLRRRQPDINDKEPTNIKIEDEAEERCTQNNKKYKKNPTQVTSDVMPISSKSSGISPV